MLHDNDTNMRTGTRERLKAKIAKSRNEKVLICSKCHTPADGYAKDNNGTCPDGCCETCWYRGGVRVSSWRTA